MKNQGLILKMFTLVLATVLVFLVYVNVSLYNDGRLHFEYLFGGQVERVQTVAGAKMALEIGEDQNLTDVTDESFVIETPGGDPVLARINFESDSSAEEMITQIIDGYGTQVTNYDSFEVPINDIDTNFVDLSFDDGGKATLVVIKYPDRLLTLQASQSINNVLDDLTALVESIRLEQL